MIWIIEWFYSSPSVVSLGTVCTTKGSANPTHKKEFEWNTPPSNHSNLLFLSLLIWLSPTSPIHSCKINEFLTTNGIILDL